MPKCILKKLRSLHRCTFIARTRPVQHETSLLGYAPNLYLNGRSEYCLAIITLGQFSLFLVFFPSLKPQNFSFMSMHLRKGLIYVLAAGRIT